VTGAVLLLVVALAPSSDRVGLAVDGSSSRASAGDSESGGRCSCCCCCLPCCFSCCFFFLRRFDDFIDDDPDVLKLKERREKMDEEADVFSTTGKFGGGVVGEVGDTVLASDNPGECRGMLDTLLLLVPPKSKSSPRPSILCVCAYRDVGDDDLIRSGGTTKAGTNLDLRADWIFSYGNGSSSS
jgi:hypothetical protein